MIDQRKTGAIDKLRASGKTVVECKVDSGGTTMSYLCEDCGERHTHPFRAGPYTLSHKLYSCTKKRKGPNRHSSYYVFHT